MIVVVDDGGYLMGLCCMDGCVIILVYIVLEKVCIVVLGCCEFKIYEDIINNGCILFLLVLYL